MSENKKSFVDLIKNAMQDKKLSAPTAKANQIQKAKITNVLSNKPAKRSAGRGR